MEHDYFGDKKFRVQVANPPYSANWSADMKFMEDARFNEYGKLAPKSKADFAFVQHMVYHMDEDGRAVVLLPHGVLFRGAAEEVIRKHLIQKLNMLDAVIGLPANLFFGTGIPVCVLVLKRERNGNADNILFIDASKDFEAGKNQNILRQSDIDKIVDAYQRREDIDKYAHVATMQEIEENGFNLNIPRYVDTFEPEEEIDLNEVAAEIRKLQSEIKDIDAELKPYFDELGWISRLTWRANNHGKCISSNGLEKRPKLRFPGFDEPWKDVRLSDVTSFRRQRTKSPKNVYVSTENLLQNFEGIVAYLDKDEVEGIAFMPGDTLLANIRPYLKKAWLASFEGICSADVLAFSPEKIRASFLYDIIARDCFIEYVMGGVKGSKMPRGDKAHILEYEFAIPKKSEQEKISTFLASIDHRIKKQREMIDVLKKYKRGAVRCLLSAKSCPLRNARWTTAKMGELGSFVKGAPLSKADISEDGTPFILYGELYTTYNEVVTSVKRRTQAQVDETF